jgi:hypothetical protein
MARGVASKETSLINESMKKQRGNREKYFPYQFFLLHGATYNLLMGFIIKYMGDDWVV